MATPHLPDFATQRFGRIAVVTHQCRKIKSSGKPRLSLAQKHMPAAISILSTAHSGKHPKRPVAAPVTSGLIATQIGEFT